MEIDGTENHTLKDSIFTALFGTPEYAREFYVTIHPEDSEVTEKDCRIVTLESILMGGMYNDFTLLVRDKIIVFSESQSVFTTNVSLRLLLYVAKTYNQYVNEHNLNLYSTKAKKIPRPEFYLVYVGGDRELPDTICLSDLFLDKQLSGKEKKEHGYLELEVKILRRTGRGDILDQYVRFCEIWNEKREQYRQEDRNAEEAVQAAMEQCREEGILIEFLLTREKEVRSIMTNLFDYKRILELHDLELATEAKAEGLQQGLQQGIQALIATVKDLAQSKETAVQIVMKRFDLTPKAAEESVALYWN